MLSLHTGVPTERKSAQPRVGKKGWAIYHPNDSANSIVPFIASWRAFLVDNISAAVGSAGSSTAFKGKVIC